MQHLEEIIANAGTAIDAADSLVALDEVRVQYLGKKGELTAQLQSLGKLPPEERRTAGQEINKQKALFNKRLQHVKMHCNVQNWKPNLLRKPLMLRYQVVVSRTVAYTR